MSNLRGKLELRRIDRMNVRIRYLFIQCVNKVSENVLRVRAS